MTGACAANVCDFWDIWCRMDAHEGQAAWMQALLSVLTIAATAAVGLRAWLRELGRRSEAALTPLGLAERLSTRFSMILDQVEREVGPSRRVTSVQAGVVLRDGSVREMQAVLAELKPLDMPSRDSADAYTRLRSGVRDFLAQLERLDTVTGSASTVDFERWYRINSRAWTDLKKAELEFSEPFRPKWIKRWRRKELQKRREAEIRKAKDAESQSAEALPD